jgi:tRNA (adenine37-N6)-methyltransferase
LLYVFDPSAPYRLSVTPFLDTQSHGLFATRYPSHPNPIGLSVVRLRARQGSVLEVGGIDVLDGTPLLDIKPYVPEFDARPDARAGWLDRTS